MDNPPTDRVANLWREIQDLTYDELSWLRATYLAMLGEDEEEGGIGVREPRNPLPESPGDAVALDLSP